MNKLKIYMAPNGYWSGVILEDGHEVARVAGCESPQDVEQAATDTGQTIDEVEIVEDSGLNLSTRLMHRTKD